jgi:hypothetical protein
MESQVLIDPLYHWKEHSLGDLTIWYIGSEKAVRDFERLLPVEGEKVTLTKGLFQAGCQRSWGISPPL